MKNRQDRLRKCWDAQHRNRLSAGAKLMMAGLLVLGGGSAATPPERRGEQQLAPIVLQKQGSFMVGGKVTVTPGRFDPLRPLEPAGQTYRGDHLYAFYQVPAHARRFPIIMWHGAGQSSKTWETTPDQREGFQNIFLRRRYSTYLIDQPRRGRAGRSLAEGTIKPVADEQFWFNLFRIGAWPRYFDGVQFDRSAETLDQYFRAMTPNTGSVDYVVMSDSVVALLDKIGPAILFTHSNAGGPGWMAAIKSKNVQAIVAFEPGSNFIFPEDEVPKPIETSFDQITGVGVPLADFKKLTRIPIQIYYGDNIPTTPNTIPTLDAWRGRLEMARLWRDTVNRHGGDVTLVHLPAIGIFGNTHFPFSDLNNGKIADLVAKYLVEKKLN